MANYNYLPQGYNANPYGYSGSAISQPTFGAINWVQGEAGARSIPVGAGQKVLLMDSESNVFYIKSSDPSGMPLPLRTFKYEEVSPTQETSSSDYITKEELNKRLEEFAQTLKEKKNEQFAL